MWPLKPDADLEALHARLAPGGWTPPEMTFAEATTALGLIRTARWFVARTQDFDGCTLFFVTQFDGSLQKYLDDFVLNGKDNLTEGLGPVRRVPDGPDATASDIVEFIARGQIKTLACYDVSPSLSNSQIYKAADWYEKTQKFQRAVASGDGNLEDKVDAFLAGAGRAVPGRAQRRRHRHRCGEPVAVRGRRRVPVALTLVAPMPTGCGRHVSIGRTWRPRPPRKAPMSDHFSGPRAIAGPAGDITDLWAFPSPERPGHLVLVAGVHAGGAARSGLLRGDRLPLPAAAAHRRGHRTADLLPLRAGGRGAGRRLRVLGSAAVGLERRPGAGGMVQDALRRDRPVRGR